MLGSEAQCAGHVRPDDAALEQLLRHCPLLHAQPVVGHRDSVEMEEHEKPTGSSELIIGGVHRSVPLCRHRDGHGVTIVGGFNEMERTDVRHNGSMHWLKFAFHWHRLGQEEALNASQMGVHEPVFQMHTPGMHSARLAPPAPQRSCAEESGHPSVDG